MSIATWKAEFYPTDVHGIDYEQLSVEEVIQHSLRKWRGLTPENLDKHDLYVKNGVLREIKTLSSPVFHIDSSTCSLCQMTNLNCKDCPLFTTLGGRSCDYPFSSPYVLWAEEGDPTKMIQKLQETLEA